jgi:hypothetical protein
VISGEAFAFNLLRERERERGGSTWQPLPRFQKREKGERILERERDGVIMSGGNGQGRREKGRREERSGRRIERNGGRTPV